LPAEPGFAPQLSGDLDRVDAGRLPPGRLITGAMDRAVMGTTERHREFIADFAAERALLHEPQMMGIAGLATADQAGVQGDMAEMIFAAIAARCRNWEHALVDAAGPMVFGSILAIATMHRRGNVCGNAVGY
jgi:hypothetical protein